MTLYFANLLQPFFGKVREALLHNPMAGESLVPIIRCEATTTSDPIREPLRPLTYLARSDAVIIEQLRSFINDLFPEPRLSALNHIPPYDGTVGKYFERFSIIIHGRIAEAVAKQSVQNQSKKSRHLLRFLLIVIIVHEFAHIARSFFHEIELVTIPVEDNPYAVELGNSLFPLRFQEAGFQAEQAYFGGIVGVVFEDEIDGERPTFFTIEFDKISHFFKVQMARPIDLVSGLSPDVFPSAHRTPIDSDVVAAKMESGLLTPFDTATLPSIPLPKAPKERTCAWLNSTHLPRRSLLAPLHPDELQGKPLPYSPTPRAAQMKREWQLRRRCRITED